MNSTSGDYQPASKRFSPGYLVGQPEIVWAKLAAMSEGAALASERLWK
jgi:hypothetical protein